MSFPAGVGRGRTPPGLASIPSTRRSGSLASASFERSRRRGSSEPIAGRLVFINAASGSFPFIQELSAKNHIVITANDSAAQIYETVLPQYLLDSLKDEAADLDKNGRISIWETFAAVSGALSSAWFSAALPLTHIFNGGPSRPK